MIAYSLGNKLGKFSGKHPIIAIVIFSLILVFIFWEGAPKPKTEVVAPAPVVKTQAQIEKDRAENMLYILRKTILGTALNPDSVIFGAEKTYQNGGCVFANAQNSFGGMTGYQEYCFFRENNKHIFTINGITQR